MALAVLKYKCHSLRPNIIKISSVIRHHFTLYTDTPAHQSSSNGTFLFLFCPYVRQYKSAALQRKVHGHAIRLYSLFIPQIREEFIHQLKVAVPHARKHMRAHIQEACTFIGALTDLFLFCFVDLRLFLICFDLVVVVKCIQVNHGSHNKLIPLYLSHVSHALCFSLSLSPSLYLSIFLFISLPFVPPAIYLVMMKNKIMVVIIIVVIIMKVKPRIIQESRSRERSQAVSCVQMSIQCTVFILVHIKRVYAGAPFSLSTPRSQPQSINHVARL